MKNFTRSALFVALVNLSLPAFACSDNKLALDYCGDTQPLTNTKPEKIEKADSDKPSGDLSSPHTPIKDEVTVVTPTDSKGNKLIEPGVKKAF